MGHWQYYLLGRILELFKRPDAALAAYQAALKQVPGFHRAQNRIAYTFASQGRYVEAEPYFNAVLRAQPGNAVAHFNLGYALDKRGEFERAIAAFREATRLNPKIDRAWYGMGLAHASIGQHVQAVAALHEAATLQPMNPHAWYQLGMAQHTLRNAQRFEEVARHLLRFDPRAARRLILDAGRNDLEHLVKDLVV